MKKTAVGIGACLILTIICLVAPVSAQDASVGAAAIPLYDPRPDYDRYQRTDEYDQFSWDLFLYIVWPALDGARGIPDPDKTLVDSGIATWETWKDIDETLRLDGKKPRPWSDPISVDYSELFTFLETSGFYGTDSVPQVDGHRLKDANGDQAWGSLRSNKATFDYIVDRELHNVEGQIAFFNDPDAEPVDFPAAAMQIKSTWIKLNDEDHEQLKDQFYTTTLTYPKDNTDHHFALIGLHIMSKVQKNWFWTTFEHASANDLADAPLTVPVSEATQEVNRQMKEKLEGSPWRYYHCRGSQWSYLNDAKKTVLLSNTTIETRVQESSSCMTCHSLASRGGENDSNIRMFKITANGKEGYVGAPPWRLFCEDGMSTTSDTGANTGEMYCSDLGLDYKYRALDFAWILRLAKKEQTADSGPE